MQSLHGIALHDLSPRAHAAHATRVRSQRRTRIALGASTGGCTFLSAHLLLHALHVAHADFQLLSAFSSIPLFATIWASSLIALIVGSLTALASDAPHALLLRVPGLIKLLSLLFALEMLVWP